LIARLLHHEAMSRRPIPHYVKFARTLALVSVALPLPAIAIVATGGGAAGCGVQGAPESDASAKSDSGKEAGQGPALGVQAGDSGPMGVAAIDAGIQTMGDDAGDDASSADFDASSDAADDGGGPHRGTPELPAGFFV
jgi:hypothetical protein